MLYHHEEIVYRRQGFVRSPILAMFQPNHAVTTCRAKISPNPSITPFTKGRKRFMASEDASASNRVRVDKEESNMDRVTETEGVGGGSVG